MSLPPTALVLETLGQFALPAAGGAAFVYVLFLALGRWAAALGSAAAVIVGYSTANFNFAALEYEGTFRLIPWRPNELSTWHSLPRAALVLTGVGLLSRWLGLLATRFVPERRWWVPNLLVWLPRWVAILIVGSWLIPAPLAQDYLWIKPALGAAMLFSWIAVDGAARGGASADAILGMAAAFFAAAIVIIFAHSTRFMDIALVLSAALVGVGLAAHAAKADASGAVPAAIGFLPGLMLNARYQTESLVPVASFWLVALAPLAWLPLSHPWIARQSPALLRIARLVLLIIPLAIAVALAMKYESLPPPD
jgi:hypothetical protein